MVYAKETGVPKGENPVEWMLLASVAVEGLEQCQEVIHWYTCRWEIEIYLCVMIWALAGGVFTGGDSSLIMHGAGEPRLNAH